MRGEFVVRALLLPHWQGLKIMEIVSESTSGNSSTSKPAFKLVWLSLFAVIAIISLSILAFVTFRPVLVLPRITLAPGFVFTDQDGNRLTNEDMRGTITLYNITHSTCKTPCPETSLIMKEVQDRLSEIDTGGLPVELVTISVDPENDTPQELRAFAESLGADLGRWHFVTGSIDQLHWVVGSGFKLYLDHLEDGRIVFDPGFMLVDGLGILRAEYPVTDLQTDIILRDINLIAEEARNGGGPNKFVYEAAHVFVCYPP